SGRGRCGSFLVGGWLATSSGTRRLRSRTWVGLSLRASWAANLTGLAAAGARGARSFRGNHAVIASVSGDVRIMASVRASVSAGGVLNTVAGNNATAVAVIITAAIIVASVTVWVIT